MNFGNAIEQLRVGSRVARTGWNGVGIFIALQGPDENSKMSSPYIYIDTTGLQTKNTDAPRSLVPWLASQTDMLADDWVIVDGVVGRKESVEEVILRKGLTGPRVTQDRIESLVVSEDYYVFPRTQMTVCCLTLVNGFNTIGHAACAYPANFDAEVGRSIARRNALAQIWALEGYLLKQDLYEGKYHENSCTCVSEDGDSCPKCPAVGEIV